MPKPTRISLAIWFSFRRRLPAPTDPALTVSHLYFPRALELLFLAGVRSPVRRPIRIVDRHRICEPIIQRRSNDVFPVEVGPRIRDPRTHDVRPIGLSENRPSNRDDVRRGAGQRRLGLWAVGDAAVGNQGKP